MDVARSLDQVRKDVQEEFNPKSYLQKSFKTLEDQGIISYIMKCLHNIYTSEGVKGHTLLDIGTGPSLHTVIPATRAFNEILLSDISDLSINMLQEWINQDQNAFDWKPYFQHYCDLLENGTIRQEMEEEFRATLKRIYKCDIHRPNPLHPVQLDGVDVISSSLCLDSACNDLQSYRKCMLNMTSLLKPNGWFVLVGLLNSRFYIDGNNKKFSSMLVNKKDVIEAVESAKLNIVKYFDELEFHEDGQTKKAFVLLASKHPEHNRHD